MQSYQPRLLRVLQICQSYTMPWAHRPALPYTSTGASVPTTKCHNLGLQQRLHHCTFHQHRSGFGPAAHTITKFYPRCGYAGTAQLEQCNEEDKLCLFSPSPYSTMRHRARWWLLTNIDTGLMTSTQRNLHRLLPPNTITPGFCISHSTLRRNKCTLEHCTHIYFL